MSTIINYVHLTGNIGKDITLINFESGMKKASFSLATTEAYKNQKGEMVSNTQWHNIVAWGKNAEAMAETLSKGNKVSIQGKLNYNNYEDKQGIKRYHVEILVSKFEKVSVEQMNVPII